MADTYNEFYSIRHHHADHYQHSDEPIVRFITLTVMKFTQIYTLAMRKLAIYEYSMKWEFQQTIFFSFKCSASAKNKAYLRLIGITHVLNTAEGSRFGQVDTGHAYYRDMPQIRYMGFPMTDHPSTGKSIRMDFPDAK